jgi:hypothetical protein
MHRPNKSAQPMPGGHRGFNREPLARHGWLQRSVALRFGAILARFDHAKA